jgi:plastocyanin
MTNRSVAVSILFWIILAGIWSGVFAACGSSSNNSNPTVTVSSSPTPASPNGSPANVTVVIAPGSIGKGPAAFGVNPLHIAVGTTVTWVNQDTVPHTSTSDTGAWDSGTIAPGQSFSHHFPAAGAAAYHCSIHGAASMSGLIIVGATTTPTPAPSTSPIAATYTSVSTIVLGPHCNSCHSGSNPSAGLDFTTYNSVAHNTVMPTLVVAGNPNASLLYIDIQGGRAPGSQEFLTPAQIQLVHDWIQAGALNN